MTQLEGLFPKEVVEHGVSPSTILMSDQIQKDHRDLELETRLYEARAAELASRFPVLASFADKDWQLEQLAKGAPLEVMAMIQGEVYEKLRNIAKVQKDLDDDDIKVWKYPRLVGATRLRLHIADVTMRDRILRDKVEDVQDEGFWKSIGLGALQFGLGTARAFHGGRDVDSCGGDLGVDARQPRRRVHPADRPGGNGL